MPFFILSAGLCLAAVGMVANAFLGLTGLVGLGKGKHSECLLPHTHALFLEDIQTAERRAHYIPLDHLPHSSGLQIAIVGSFPNAEERLKCVVNGRATVQCPGGLSSDLLLQQASSFRPTHSNVNGQKWRLGALKSNEIGVTAAELAYTSPARSPSLLLIEDDAHAEYLLMIGNEGEMALSSLSSHFKDKLVSFNGGEKGYAIEIPVPKGFVDAQLPSPFYVKVFSEPKILKPSGNNRSDTPCLYLQFSEGNYTETLPLVYDATASGVRWPVCNGKYLARYQPKTHHLPFTLERGKWKCAHTPGHEHTEKCCMQLLIDGKQGASVGFETKTQLKKGYLARLVSIKEKGTYLHVERKSMLTLLTYPGLALAVMGAFLLGRKRKLSAP